MKKKYFFISLSFILVNLLVLTIFFGSELRANSLNRESNDCDCSASFPPESPWGCATEFGSVLCFYNPGPHGYPEYIWEDYMKCVPGLDEDYCNCDWEYNYCRESD